MDFLLRFVIGLVVAACCTPAGVSGAFLLLPIQVLFLHVPSPAVTGTNLLYNVISTPAGALTFRRAGRLDVALTRTLLCGTIPGVVLGTLVRLTWLASQEAFSWVAGAVLALLGARLIADATVLRSRATDEERHEATRSVPTARLVALGSLTGFVGGIYGLGGAALLVPWLVGVERLPVRRVAGAGLVTTLATSVVGLATFSLASGAGIGAGSQPEWRTGLALGLGGAAGSILGAHLQPRLPVGALRFVIGAAAIVAGSRLVVG